MFSISFMDFYMMFSSLNTVFALFYFCCWCPPSDSDHSRIICRLIVLQKCTYHGILVCIYAIYGNSLVIISVSSSIYLQFWYCLIPIGSFSYSLTNIYLLFIFLSLILFDKSTGAGLWKSVSCFQICSSLIWPW